jgi:hypothetical protein
MSGRDRLSPQRVSTYILLLLILCTCSLAVHFIAEGLGPGLLSLGMTGQAGHALPFNEHTQDLFIYSFLGASLPVYLYFFTMMVKITHSKLFSISLQIPPPYL